MKQIQLDAIAVTPVHQARHDEVVFVRLQIIRVHRVRPTLKRTYFHSRQQLWVCDALTTDKIKANTSLQQNMRSELSLSCYIPALKHKSVPANDAHVYVFFCHTNMDALILFKHVTPLGKP